ncbi:DUF4238 domain-containing protein [Shewanella baltica]|uniref:DUF4238 domain-containing protein n=1 Tax=Shewanella baltica TaxID=62322 RepID=UPI00217F218D|nr:DUF4238 domain-containing protein [Shewanella baltica]MCS6230349.1 DUF4238 domain-containing protein [Shewanella baltica]
MVNINKKDLERRKNHHYVWAYYMQRWSFDKRQVYYTTKNNNDIRLEYIKKIAAESHFYRVKPLTLEHVQTIIKWSSKCPNDLHKLHMIYLSDYLIMQSLESRYKQSDKKDEIIDQIIEAWKCNGIENYHTAHELEVRVILDALANRDFSVLDKDENMNDFMAFIGQQIARTKNIKDTVSNIKDGSRAALDMPSQELADNMKKLMLECWWFMSYMFGMNLGRSLYLDRKDNTHCLLINDTDMSFITSDQPIVNVHQALTDEIRPVEDHESDLYYPISPNVAYMINKSNRFPSGSVQVSVDVVREMNIKVAKRANFHIIGNSEESLKPYKKYVGSNLRAVKKSI